MASAGLYANNLHLTLTYHHSILQAVQKLFMKYENTGGYRSMYVMYTHTYTHVHPFIGPFSGTTQVSRYQKGRTNLDFTEARDSEWQLHQLGQMQVCTSL